MPKTIPTPAMPFGVRFDPDASIIDNAKNAWEQQRDITRMQQERNARVLARRVFRTDDIEFQYDAVTGLDKPTFVIEDELVIYFHGQHGTTFALVEICGDCGKDWQGREFDSLATLGKRINERDEDDPYLCRMCKLMSQAKKR